MTNLKEFNKKLWYIISITLAIIVLLILVTFISGLFIGVFSP